MELIPDPDKSVSNIRQPTNIYQVDYTQFSLIIYIVTRDYTQSLGFVVWISLIKQKDKGKEIGTKGLSIPLSWIH